MAKHDQAPIRAEAYMNIGGIERSLDELSVEQRNSIGAALRVKCLNAMFAGKAVFESAGSPAAGELLQMSGQSSRNTSYEGP